MPTNQSSPIPLSFETFNEIVDIGGQVLLILPIIHSVDSRRCLLSQELPTPSEILLVKHPIEIAKSMLRMTRCPVCYSPQ
jgi:hypothetical protein